MNCLIDHHRSSFQRAKTAPIAGSPGWSIARSIQTSLLDPNCKPGMTVIEVIPRGTEGIAIKGAENFVRKNLNVLIDRVEITPPTDSRAGFIKVRRASKIREGTLS